MVNEAKQMDEYLGIRTTVTCEQCDGSGELDCGRDWQVMTCEACNGAGEFYACLDCKVQAIQCDDRCEDCEVQFYLDHPEEIDLSDSHWKLPEWVAVLARVNAAKAAKEAA